MESTRRTIPEQQTLATIRAELSSTTDPRESSQRKTPAPKQLKIYNIMYSNFSYEHDVMCQQRIAREFDMDKSTPSMVSDQSLATANYCTPIFYYEESSPFPIKVLNSVPVFREILQYGDANPNSSCLTQSEFFKILKKLRITNNLEIALNLLEKFDTGKDNQITVKEFLLFFCRDIRSLDFDESCSAEIVFRLGVEIFRVVGKERTHLEIRDLMNFFKENEGLDIDFIQLLEMFDFYDDIYNGTLKRKVNLLSFFQNTGLRIAKALDKGFLHYLKGMFREHKAKAENPRTVIKLYEKTTVAGAQEKDKAKNLNDKRNELKIILERNLNQINNINEIIIDELPANLNENSLQKEIEGFFKENQPKNKGWLFRKSQENASSWQNLFFCLVDNNTRLISLSPKTLKKAISISNIQIHKCNFLETVASDLHRGKKLPRKPGSNPEEALKHCFFILDLATLKTYLIRSEESLAIFSVINFYISKGKQTLKSPDTLIQIIENVEPYYSGLIEIACCKKSDIGNFHSDLKNYTFKSQFLEIKGNKLTIYLYAMKDSLELIDYELKVQEINENHLQFAFYLEKRNSPGIQANIEDESRLKSNKESFVVFNAVENPTIEPQKPKQNPFPKATLEKNSFTTLQMEVIYEKEENKESRKKGGGAIFRDILQKLSGRKNDRVFLAADSEFKRKEWVFSLNYYKTLILKAALDKKDQAHHPNPSKINQESVSIKASRKLNALFKSSIQNDKGANNPDFYDVFSPLNNEDPSKSATKKSEGKNDPPQIRNPVKHAGPNVFLTDPEGVRNLESEDLLFTFTNLNKDSMLILNNARKPSCKTGNPLGTKYLLSQGNEAAPWLNVSNKEIRTFKEEELWQKFLKHFLKANHACTEMDLNPENAGNLSRNNGNESLSLLECENELEDVPRARNIMQSHYNMHKK